MTPHDNPPNIADQNIERLISQTYRPEQPDAAFAERLTEQLCQTAQQHAAQRSAKAPRRFVLRRVLTWTAAAAAAVILAVVAYDQGQRSRRSSVEEENLRALASRNDLQGSRWSRTADTVSPNEAKLVHAAYHGGLSPKPRPAAPKLTELAVGEGLTTKAGERRRLGLADGAIIYLNQNSAIHAAGERRLELRAGEVFVEAPSPADQTDFTVHTPTGDILASGAKFALRVTGLATNVAVTQGAVRITGMNTPLVAGQQLDIKAAAPMPAPAPLDRASHILDWTRDLMAAADSPLVPASKHTGGAVVVVDPNGQEAKLSMRKYHIDVHIEDGFARTTIDQTFFNHENRRLEGTFYFPLPPDASLSRLAMYVEGKLMEGGMAERDEARQIYESIVYTQKDPALLEWVDGSTFKMRVFPLEARQEKRIVISYAQKLPDIDGHAQYRFPAGHSLDHVGKWSFHARIKNGKDLAWLCDSHQLKETREQSDLLLDGAVEKTKMDRDLVLHVHQKPTADTARFVSATHEGAKYLMFRYRPRLTAPAKKERRDWVFLFESSGDRDPLVARAQIEIVKTLLENAEQDDTFTILSAGTTVQRLSATPRAASPENVKAALAELDKTHLIGALDLGLALDTAEESLKDAKNPHLVHVGSGVPVLGERQDDQLVKRLNEKTTYVGIGVGKRWNRAFMKQAAERTGGWFTQINPDEPIRWRTFDLLATLNTPRLLNIKVIDEAEKLAFLGFTTTIAQGEEACAVARIEADKPLPKSVTLSGILEGRPYTRTFEVKDVAAKADYLPRTWAKLEIDRLLAKNSANNKGRIVELSKAMYVMTPFTSLLVLENEAMYQQFKVDRGRKDHWALYPCPEKIPVVHEPLQVPAVVKPETVAKSGRPEDVLNTVLVRIPPRAIHWPNQPDPLAGYQGLTAYQMLTGVPIVADEYWTALGDLDNLAVAWSRDGRQLLNLHGNMLGRGWGYANYDFIETDEFRRSTRFLFAESRSGRPNLWFESSGRLHGRFDNGITTYNLWDGTSNEVRLRSRFTPLTRGLPISGPVASTSSPALEGLLSDLDLSVKFQPHYSRLDTEATLLKRELIRGELLMERGIEQLEQLRRSEFEVGFLLSDLKSLSLSKKIPALRKKRLAEGNEVAARIVRGNPYHGLQYQRPYFNNDTRLWTDLLAYAPGMNSSSADLLALLDAQQPQAERKPGDIDPEARKLIDKARAAGWQTLVSTKTDARLTFNGQGQFVLERTTPEGLGERVVCDGKELLHLYAELGVGARRVVSRFQRFDFVPWALPPVEDLARGAALRLVDANTVAIVPTRNDESAKADPKSLELHLVFAPEGRLSERRLIETPSRKLLYREIYSATGEIRAFDSEGKTLADHKFDIKPAESPDLKPNLAQLVVLKLPLRTSDQAPQDVTTCAAWTEEMALDRIATCLCTHEGQIVARIIAQRFLNSGDQRIGFWTLLLASRYSWNPAEIMAVGPNFSFQFDPVKAHPFAPLAKYAAEMREAERHGNREIDVIGGSADSFLNKLREFRNITMRWQSGQVSSMNEPGRQAERERAWQFIRNCRSAPQAWAVLSVLQNHASSADFERALGEISHRFDDHGPLGYAVRYERARKLVGTNPVESRKQFLDLFKEARAQGELPLIDSSFAQAFQTDKAAQDQLGTLMQDTSKELMKIYGRSVGFLVAWQCHQFGAQPLAEIIFADVLAGMTDKDRVSTTLAGVEYLWHTGQQARADALLQPLLDTKDDKQSPYLWRLASYLATQRGQLARSLNCLERAIEIEYQHMPALINLEIVRQDYQQLLSQYQQLADAMATLEAEPPRDFLARVVRIADRWRSLDQDPTAACQAAARIMETLGAKDLAWSYLTTPLAAKPNEAAPWQSLAQTLKSQGNFDLADRAYDLAFDAEPTNAQILWDRAQNLLQRGKSAEARQLFQKIVDGKWQPRFSGVQNQARGYVK